MVVLAAWSQTSYGVNTEGSIVNQSSGPPRRADQALYYFNGAGYLEYVCKAWSRQPTPSTVVVASATNANPVVFTVSAGHKFGDFATLGATVTPVVQISGATGSWGAVNGVWKATVLSATTFSIPVNSTSFGAYPVSGITFRTQSPLHNAAVWSIQRFFYDASNRLIASGWAGDPDGAGAVNLNKSASTGYDKSCENRTNYAYH